MLRTIIDMKTIQSNEGITYSDATLLLYSKRWLCREQGRCQIHATNASTTNDHAGHHSVNGHRCQLLLGQEAIRWVCRRGLLKAPAMVDGDCRNRPDNRIDGYQSTSSKLIARSTCFRKLFLIPSGKRCGPSPAAFK